jgi:hypothetical protein
MYYWTYISKYKTNYDFLDDGIIILTTTIRFIGSVNVLTSELSKILVDTLSEHTLYRVF